MQKIVVVGCGLILSVAVGAMAEGEDKLSNPVRMQPFVSSGVLYEKTTEEENVFFDNTAGLRLGYAGFELDGNAMGFVSSRIYEGEKDRNFTAGGGSLRLKQGAMERLLVQGDLAFRRVEDIDVYGSELAVGGVSPDSVLDSVTRSRRDVLQAGVSVGRNLTDKMDLETGYRYDDVDYRERGLLNISTHMVQIETSRKLTDKTAGLLTVKGGMQDHEALNDPAYYAATHLGLKVKSTEKVNLKVGAGVQRYDRPDGQDDQTGFSFDGSATWLATEKIVLQVGARNGFQLSPLYADNASQFTIFSIGAKYQATETLTLSGNMAYRIDDYLDDVAVGGGAVASRKDKGFAVRLRADYQMPFKPMKLFANLSHENTDSTLADSDRTRAGFGMQFVF